MNVFEEFRGELYDLPQTTDLHRIRGRALSIVRKLHRHHLDAATHQMAMDYMVNHFLAQYPEVVERKWYNDRRGVLTHQDLPVMPEDLAGVLRHIEDEVTEGLTKSFNELVTETVACAERHVTWSRPGVWSGCAQQLVDHVMCYPILLDRLIDDVTSWPAGVIKERMAKELQVMAARSDTEAIEARAAYEAGLIHLLDIRPFGGG